jgi:ATP-dependent Clp endopeptidase proteolytic subunit ClpP
MAYKIYLYDEIGPAYYGLLDGKWMVDELAKAGGQDVELRINSPGGSVFDGQAMYTALAGYGGKVTAHIDSLAASAASFVMMAASSVKIAENAMIMIHKAWGFAMGNAGDMRQTADLLDKIDAGLVAQYVARTGQTEEQIREWMTAETWMDAKEAVDRGFADEIGTPLAVKACIRDGMFAKTPAALLAPANSVAPRVQAASLARRLAIARAT